MSNYLFIILKLYERIIGLHKRAFNLAFDLSKKLRGYIIGHQNIPKEFEKILND